VLELGCGTGLVSVGAVLAGAQSVMLTDCVPEALPLALCNVQTASSGSVVTPRTLNFNKECPPELVGAFDLVCGADVLYIGRVVASVVNLAWQALRPGGALLITDPGRGYTEDLASRAEDAGFEVCLQREMRGIPTAVCRMGACAVVVCLKPISSGSCSSAVSNCIAAVERCCDRLSSQSSTSEKGTRCDYIFRPSTS